MNVCACTEKQTLAMTWKCKILAEENELCAIRLEALMAQHLANRI
jgi:hypothetical protein